MDIIGTIKYELPNLSRVEQHSQCSSIRMQEGILHSTATTITQSCNHCCSIVQYNAIGNGVDTR